MRSIAQARGVLDTDFGDIQTISVSTDKDHAVIDKTVGDKAYANYGRYSNMDNQSFARSAAPLRLFRADAFFNRTTGALITTIVRANQTGKRVLENIDPTHTDEYLGGYARPFGNGWSAEVWGMYRKTTDIIEDFPGVDRTTASGFRYGNIPGYRKYTAGTVEVRKALRDNWSMDVSYTLSKLKGNWDLDYATQLFYSSSYIEDGPGLYVEDRNRTGTLTGDRTHLERARRTAAAALDRFADPAGGVLPDEGMGDHSVFKGILAR